MALAATSLAPFIPSIAASPKLESAPLADIIAGRVPLYIGLCSKDGEIKSFGRKLVNLGGSISFDAVTETCIVTHGFLATEDDSWWIPIHFGRTKQSYALMPGDTFNVMDVHVPSQNGGAA